MWKWLYVIASCQSSCSYFDVDWTGRSGPLQEEFVPWHKEHSDFQSAHIHLTHPDSCPWSRMMSSAGSPLPEQDLITYIIRIGATEASLFHINTRGTGSRVNRLAALMIVPDSSLAVWLSHRGEREYTLSPRIHKKSHGRDVSDVFTVMCWSGGNGRRTIWLDHRAGFGA